MSIFSNIGDSRTMASSSDGRDSQWYQKPSKKVIPNHLVPQKKIGFQLSAVANNKRDQQGGRRSTGNDSEGFKSTEFNIISFGNKAHRNSTASFQDSSLLALKDSASIENDDLPLYNYNEDLPPPRSLYDLNDESSLTSNKPAQNIESFITKDPRSFSNAFVSNGAASNESKTDKKNISKNPLQHSESAVLVFGYPESMATQVIAHFSEFGTILEDFEAAKNTATTSPEEIFEGPATGAFIKADETTIHEHTPSPPILCGKSWVKLTYDNPSSAADALQESGSVFNGALIGVVPYTKAAVEKLQNRKLSSTEDIGGGLQGLHIGDLSSKVDKGVIGDSNDIQASYIKRLDIKDGSEMFLKASSNGNSTNSNDSKKPKQQLGLVGTISNYLFGFHDL
ncbi:hypothetical protein SBP28_002201 [Candidozyma auris]